MMYNYCTDILTLYVPGGGEWPLLVSTTNRIHSLNEQAHTFAFDILFARLKQKLTNIPRLRVRVLRMQCGLSIITRPLLPLVETMELEGLVVCMV